MKWQSDKDGGEQRVDGFMCALNRGVCLVFWRKFLSGSHVIDMDGMWKSVLNLACLEPMTCGTEG